MFGALKIYVLNLKWRRLFRDLDERERKARKCNNCRALGEIRRQRQQRVHAALRGLPQ